MSVHSDIATALSSVAGGRVYWELAPQEDAGDEYVVIREVGHLRETTLNGYAGLTLHTFMFDCWSVRDKLAALTVAGQVEAAMETLTLAYPEEVGADDFITDPMELMVARKYSIWHV